MTTPSLKSAKGLNKFKLAGKKTIGNIFTRNVAKRMDLSPEVYSVDVMNDNIDTYMNTYASAYLFFLSAQSLFFFKKKIMIMMIY